MVYVVSDIHGCLNTFLSLLKKCKFDEKKDVLYILGDIIDRGPLIWETYEWVKERLGKNVFMILGNHEDMFITDVFYLKGKEIIDNKEEITEENLFYVKQYDNYCFYFDRYLTILKLIEKGKTVDDLLEMAHFFNKLPLYYVVNIKKNKFRLIHAYCREDLEKTTRNDFIWNRDFAEIRDSFCKNNNIIYGHTPTLCDGKNGKIEILIDENKNASKINIDCGCVYGNKLCILRLDDMKYWYQKNID